MQMSECKNSDYWEEHAETMIERARVQNGNGISTPGLPVGTIQIEKRIFDEIIEALNNPQLYDVLGNAEKTIFARIVAPRVPSFLLT